MSVDHLPVVLWADRTTVRLRTGYLPFDINFGQDTVHLLDLEESTWNKVNCIQGIDNKVSQLPAWAWQLEQCRGDIIATIDNLQELRDANTRYFNQTANLPTEDPQIVHLPLLNESQLELSYGTKLDARWWGLYQVTEIAQSLGTYWLAEPNQAELVG